MQAAHELVGRFRQAQSDARFVHAIEGLRVPPDGVEAKDNADPRFQRYVETLCSVYAAVGVAIQHPREVYFGDPVDGITVAHTGFIRTEHPPRREFGVRLPTIETLNERATIGHFAQVAALWGLVGNMAEKTDLAQKMWRGLRGGTFTQVALGPNWIFRVGRERFSLSRTWLTPRLIPADRDEYIREWIEEHRKRVRNAMRPDRVRGAVLRAAKGNVGVHVVVMGEFNLFDIGGMTVAEMAQNLGWKPQPESEDPVFAYTREEEGRATPHLLVLAWDPRSERERNLRVEAVVSPELRTVIEHKFQVAYQQAVNRVVEDRLAAASDSIDLSPLAIAQAALEAMGQRLETYEFVQRRTQLARVAVDVLLDEYGDHPLLERSQDVRSVRSIRDIAKRSEGQPSRDISLGWKPEEVVLRLANPALLE